MSDQNEGTPIPQELIDANPALKTFANVEALASSYTSLQKTYDKKTNELDVLNKQVASLREGTDFDPDQVQAPDTLKPYLQRYSELGLKEDVAMQLAADEAARDVTMKQMQENQRNLELSIKWGDQTTSRIEAVTEWAAANLDPHLVKSMSTTASGMENLRILMENQMGGKVTTPGAVPPEGRDSRIDQLKKERDAILSEGKYLTDYTVMRRYDELMREMSQLVDG